MALFALAPGLVEAGFTNALSINSTARRNLENNTVYMVTGDYEVKGSTGFSAYTMAENSTAVIYIPSGKTLTLCGGKAKEKSGAGAGIEVPSSSTLIITGSGKLVTTGGVGANGVAGDSADDAICNDDDIKGGWGAAGGDGGGGAGAGIGGKGGSAGTGGSRPGEPPKQPCSRWSSDMHDTSGNNGNGGSNGSSGTGGGNVYVLGTVTVEAASGTQGNGGNGGSKGNSAWCSETWEYHAGYGGGGGGGGGGGAAYSIGGGGGGGGGGGSGGNGGHYWTSRGGNPSAPDGGGGSGGGGSTSNSGGGGGGTRDHYKDTYGGWGGSGGSAGATGSSGSLYADSGVHLTAPGRTASAASTHSAIEYTLTFDDDWRVASNITVRFGYALPKAPTSSRYGYTFKGWYTGAGGAGTQYYNAQGDAVVPDWANPGDLTLYAKWEQNSEELSSVTLWINGGKVVEGQDSSGDGWAYNAHTGKINITGAGKTYEIRGCDADGFAQIVVKENCTIRIVDTLEMSPGPHGNYTPITVARGSKGYSDATLEVADGAHCSLTGSSGRPAIFVDPSETLMGRDSTLVIKARGVLDVTGGEGAADLGLRSGDPVAGCGKIYIETYDNWFANIRPGHGMNDGNGFANDIGRSAKIYSYTTSNYVYSVRVSFPGESGGEKTIYRQRILGEVKDTVKPDVNGHVWLWVYNGDYEWGEKVNASYEAGDRLWNAMVSGEHIAATSFVPVNIKINGEDIAHRSGAGWSTRYEGDSHDKVTLVITNAGPHVVSGEGNAAIDVKCSTSLVVSNLVLDATSWSVAKCAIWLDSGVTLDLTVKGTNSLSASSGAPGIAVYSGRTLNLDGDGRLTTQGGQKGAGIGGGGNADGKASGKINISGGFITAFGGAYAAGIGSGQTGFKSEAITVSGGVVMARGGQYAAGIGGGHTGAADVTITGGTVFPTAGSKASAIGCGYSCLIASDNTFGLAAIYATKDGVSPAAKNGGGTAVFPVSFDMGIPSCNVTSVIIEDDAKTCRDLWTDENGKLTLWLEPTNGSQYTITITAVDADGEPVTKSWGYKMDNNGNLEFSTDMLTVDSRPVVGGKSDSGTGWNYDAGSRILAIAFGDHTISGLSTNGSINVVVTGDGVNISMNDLALATTYSDQSPFVISNRCTVSLSGNNIIECICNPNARYTSGLGSQYTAAIEVPEGASLTIDGTGTLIANGGLYGAGIGSRGIGNMNAGSIVINGGYVYATGGWYGAGGGAGIGGGDGGGVASVLVTGGYVHATGGKGACGIGTGKDGPLLADSTFHVTGGTVLVEKGDGSFSDFTTACGSVISQTGSKIIVIDGGSVRPKNFYGAANPEPNPVNSNGVKLVCAIFKGVGVDEGDSVEVLDDLWPQYNGVTLYADEGDKNKEDGGMICIWGEKTNTMHTVTIQSPSIPGGAMPFTISASSNTVQTVAGGEPPDSREIDGKTCWRVEVHALPMAKRMNVTGIGSPYVQGTVVSDYSGKLYIYLPNGEYDFKVGAYSYHASVADATTVATYMVGILVNDVDIGNETGLGWTYDGTEEKLVLDSGAVGYRLSGTNPERRVSVYAAAAGVKVRSDRLVLKSADDGPFRLQNLSATLEFTGGTLSAGPISAKATVSGGAFNTTLENAVAPSGATAYRVTINGLARNSLVEIENVEGLGSYDTSNIWSDASGSVCLYLPNGMYYFIARSGGVEKAMVAVVENEDATAVEFILTGVSVNGRDVAWLGGPGWRNEDGLVRLYSATNYVVSGTNDGAAVTLSVEASGATLTLDNLVMANEFMNASPIVFVGGSEQAHHYEMALVGTNELHCAERSSSAVELGESVALAVSGAGRLEASGSANGQPGIGPANGDTGTSSIALTVLSGDIVATGGANAAGIGGGGGQEGFAVNIYGGTVTATGGTGGAGIGGGAYSRGGYVTVTNGVMNAYGGTNAAGIGGGLSGDSGTYRQSGGTVVARSVGGAADIGAGIGGGSGSGYTTITGGSLNSTTEKLTVQAKNALKDNVYCVTIPTGRPNFDVGARMSEWDGYLLTGVKTDDEGKVYIWLPDGTYYLNIGGVPCRAVVDGADTVAEVWAVGVTVNGEDVALRSGAGWSYDPIGHALVLTDDGCVASGTSTTGQVYLDFTNDVSVVLSNLVITSSSEEVSPFEIASNVVVTVTLEGENNFGSTGQYTPAIHVPETATLTITNIDSVVAVPDLDDIKHYTNTVEIIEEEDDGHGGTVVVTNYVDIVTVVTNYYDTVVPARLQATGAAYAAGIGGGYEESYGTIEICGGSITAKGGDFAAGIGSGSLAQEQANDASFVLSGTLKIRGGTVDARSVGRGAGLGGGYYHSGGDIEIFGGTVLAEGGYYGAGIGAGPYARAKAISISGGNVIASGGTSSGAGIGGGMEGKGVDSYGAPRTVTISGGVVTARGGDAGGAGIGSGAKDRAGMQVVISGGTVVATGGNSSSLIYGSDDIGVGGCDVYTTPTFYPLVIKGASVHATWRTVSNECVEPAPSNGTDRVWCVTVQTPNPNRRARIDYLDGFGEDSEIYADADGKIYLWLPNGTHIFAVGSQMFIATVANADATATQWFTGVKADGVDVASGESSAKRWYYDYGAKTLHIVGNCVISGANADGCVNIRAATTNELSFTISNLYLKATSKAKASPVAVTNGTVTVCLAGANTLDATETDDYAGLNVVSPATLVITNLEESASLLARSGEDAAAIGGNQGNKDTVNSSTGTIRINGGRIIAQAKDSGAGIGSGYKGTSGDIYISGGMIDAIGGKYYYLFSAWCGAGIGGGNTATVGSGRTIAISGGTVMARGGYGSSTKYAADIGAGYDGSGLYRIEISGGSVYPASSDSEQYFNNSDSSDAIPVNDSNSQVYKVMLHGFTPYARVDLGMVDYGTNDVYADASGRVHLWLAPGLYRFLDGSATSRCIRVNSDGTHDFIDMPASYGVEVNGVDVSMLSGEGWSMDPTTSNLVITADCTLSGTNTVGQVLCTLKGVQLYVAVSNLWLEATGAARPPLAVDEGLFAYVTFGGTNNFVAAPNLAAIEVPANSWISLDGEGWLMATGGVSAASIGASDGMAMQQERVWINSGNIAAEKISGARIHGGNIAASEFITPTPVNWNGDTVYRVKFSGFTPGEPVKFEENIHGLFHDYKANGILADGNGDVYLWLPNGNYSIYANGQMYVAVVNDAPTNAAPSDVEVYVNGVNVGTIIGNGWVYDPGAKLLKINWAQPYTLSGSNTTGAVRIETMTNSWLTFDKLNLSGYDGVSPITAASNSTMTVTLTNSSSIVNSSASGAMSAIDVPVTSMLKIKGAGNIVLASQGATAIDGGGTVEITGASVRMTDGVGETAAVDGTPNPAYCVAVTGLVANAMTEFTDLPGGYNNVLADDDGNVYLWLTNATYFFRADGAFKKAVVAGQKTTAEDYVIGITVNGEDITRASGTGWTFDGSRLVLTNEADHAVISGSNLEYGVSIELTECLSVVFSNLCFAARGLPAVELRYHLTTGYLHSYHEIKGLGRNYIKSDKRGFYGSPAIVLGGTFVVDAPTNSVFFAMQGGSFRIQGNDRGFCASMSTYDAPVYMVTVDGLAQNAKVAFDNLPPDYNTDEIYADAEGKVYLWLPENWDDPHPSSLLFASPKKGLLGAPSGTAHTFTANGYNYTVTIDSSVGGAVAEQGDPLPLESLTIDDFAVGDGYLVIRFTAKPATWLYGFADLIRIRSSATLPIPDSDESLLDLSGAGVTLEGLDAATIIVPFDAVTASGFFKVSGRSP